MTTHLTRQLDGRRRSTAAARGRRRGGHLLLALMLAACGDRDIADDHVSPPLETMVETPGDWSQIEIAAGQTPAKSLILSQGPIVTDLKALLGPDYLAYRDRMVTGGGVLQRIGGLLVSTTAPDAPDAAYLVIDPADHGLAIGYATPRGWVVRRTAGHDVALPPAVQALRSAHVGPATR